MKILKDPRWILTLIISLTLLSAEINQLFPPSFKDKLEHDKIANILLIGIDARPGETQTRSDTLILLSINKPLNKAALVSIPRDTRIVFQGANRKINMVNQLKGPEALCKEAGKLLDTDVDHYMIVNFSGFQEIIDAMGGVYINVDIRLRSYTSGVFLEKGYQCLSGKEALEYVRFRTNPDMDIGRIKRQQKLLMAMAKQILQTDNLLRLPRLITTMQQYVTTNIRLNDMLYLGYMARQFNEKDIIVQTLPGYAYFTYNGVSFWEADQKIAGSLLNALFAGHHFEANQPAPPWVNSP
jgi:LCP family protein required for cell wall assembly